jgi:hypothetical protein
MHESLLQHDPSIDVYMLYADAYISHVQII